VWALGAAQLPLGARWPRGASVVASFAGAQAPGRRV
jgi:hypothetical protein